MKPVGMVLLAVVLQATAFGQQSPVLPDDAKTDREIRAGPSVTSTRSTAMT